jgi:hypothetical protein
MGYSTDFTGSFLLDRQLTLNHQNYLLAFASKRRMKRDPNKAITLQDRVRLAVELPVGIEAGYFVGGTGLMGQGNDASVIDNNRPPEGQPGLWCQWVSTDDGYGIKYNGDENAYDYTEWLEYLIEHFLEPWGYVLNGNVSWQGEESTDSGVIYVKDNQVEAVENKITNNGPSWKTS